MMRRAVSAQIAQPLVAAAAVRFISNAGQGAASEALKAQVEAAEQNVRVLEEQLKKASASSSTSSSASATGSSASSTKAQQQPDLNEELNNLRQQMNGLKQQLEQQNQIPKFSSWDDFFKRAHEERTKAWQEAYERYQTSASSSTGAANSHATFTPGCCGWRRASWSGCGPRPLGMHYTVYRPFGFFRFAMWVMFWYFVMKMMFFGSCCSSYQRVHSYVDADGNLVTEHRYGGCPARAGWYTWNDWERENWAKRSSNSIKYTDVPVIEESKDTKKE